MDTRWRTLSSVPLVKDRWIDLRADRCLTQAGAEIDPFYVLAYPDWVQIVALTPQRELVLVSQYRHAAGRSFLELPAGTMDPRDTGPEQAARRELTEETGCTAERWQAVATLHPNPATHTNRVHTFLALDVAVTHARHLDTGEEGLGVRLMKLDEVLAGLQDGLLGQSMHVASLLLATRLIPDP